MNRPLFPDITVNGETIPSAAIAAEAQNHTAPQGKPGLAWRKAARALAMRALLLQEARRRDLTPQPADLGEGRYETDEEALIRGLLDDEISTEPPDEATVHAAWAKDPDRFRSPPLWEASHILCAVKSDDDKAEAKAKSRAEASIAALAGDAGGFAALAARESDCDSRAAGGALGQLGPGDTVPEFEAALRALEPGDITRAPVRTRFGYHVIRLDARADGRVLPFEAVRERLAEALEKAAWARSAQRFADGLVAGAEIQGLGDDMSPRSRADAE